MYSPPFDEVKHGYPSACRTYYTMCNFYIYCSQVLIINTNKCPCSSRFVHKLHLNRHPKLFKLDILTCIRVKSFPANLYLEKISQTSRWLSIYLHCRSTTVIFGFLVCGSDRFRLYILCCAGMTLTSIFRYFVSLPCPLKYTKNNV